MDRSREIQNRPANVGNRPVQINSKIANNQSANLGTNATANRSDYGWGTQPAYRSVYRHGWVNGYWHGNRPGFGAGLATGGLLGWAWGSTPYFWGYSSYANPYSVAVPVPIGQPLAAPAVASFNDAEPINTQAPPPSDPIVDQAEILFDSAREVFRQGDYPQAMDRINQVIAQVPNDATAHEFRALVFFALKDYRSAAATLYPVLSVGPGWDWTTLVGLYPSLEVYNEQFRALEKACQDDPESPQDQFVLAYHYLTQGHIEAAAQRFQNVARLEPEDQLSARLARELSGEPASTPPAPVSNHDYEPKEDSLFGTWTARPTTNVAIHLTLQPDGNFTWQVIQKEEPQTITGKFSASNDLLTLAQAENGAVLVGKVVWQDASHFHFTLVNTGAEDPGLAFSR